MSILPDRERVESTRIPDAVKVTTLWTQRALNATARYSLEEDGVAGQRTFDALNDLVALLGVGGIPPGRASDDQHVIMSLDLERVLIAGEPEELAPEGPSYLFWGIGALVLGATAWVFYRTAFSRLDGFQENWMEFRQHLISAKEQATRGDCTNAYAHWEQARLLTDALDDQPKANKTLIAAAREVRRNC